MKTYQIELRRTSYVNLTIEAENVDEAEMLAWQELASDGSYGDSDSNWEVESIELEDIATDETRSYGPQGETA
jgi:hypothetical protein